MMRVAEALVASLAERGVDCVFGIPGVHTIELYRGLSKANIRHVTPRHEQGAGFMADGYARVSGKPGVAFVITGPGLTNTLTAMGQARADSVPMLVVSGVNATHSLGKGLGHLHELPDQQALARTVALVSERVNEPEELEGALQKVFAPFFSGRLGPTHIEVPLDIAGLPVGEGLEAFTPVPPPAVEAAMVSQAIGKLTKAERPVILVGGGARRASKPLQRLAEQLDAPVIQTVNGRGVLFNHPLGVPASPSLQAVRDLIEDSDLVLAVGTELGQTDFDMYASGVMPEVRQLIRIDLCEQQLQRHQTEVAILGDAFEVVTLLNEGLAPLQGEIGNHGKGQQRALQTREAAFAEIGPQMRALTEILNGIRDTVPNAIVVGDSAQPIYAGNLYYDHDRVGGWFTAATGFGALGYGIPAAIGAAFAAPSARVICLCGDGGAQFSLTEMMCAVDENLPICFVIWNNHGYKEISTSMEDAGVQALGCDPTPPDFEHMAKGFGLPFWRCNDAIKDINIAVEAAARIDGPSLVEIVAK